MLNNPWIRKALELLAGLAVMSFFSRMPMLGRLVTVLFGAAAAGIWMLRFNRPVMSRLYRHPHGAKAIDLLCRVSGEAVPNDACPAPAFGSAQGVSPIPAGSGPAPAPAAPIWQQRPAVLPAPSFSAAPRVAAPPAAAPSGTGGRLSLATDYDFALAARTLQEHVKGCGTQIARLMEQLRCNARLRATASAHAPSTPLGFFLLVGHSGLGKRTLATAAGQLLYPGDAVSLIDATREDAVRQLLEGARRNPWQTFVIESFERAGEGLNQALMAIAAGRPLIDDSNGASVSFRDAFLFLLVHRDAAGLMGREQATGAGTGGTVVADTLGAEIRLDRRILWMAHAVLLFTLPSAMEIAEIVLLVMQAECRRYQVELGRVSPAIVAREVQEVQACGGFELLPGRVGRRFRQPVMSALAAGRRHLDLEMNPAD